MSVSSVLSLNLRRLTLNDRKCYTRNLLRDVARMARLGSRIYFVYSCLTIVSVIADQYSSVVLSTKKYDAKCLKVALRKENVTCLNKRISIKES